MRDILTTITIGNMKIKVPASDFSGTTNSDKALSLAHSHANFEFHILFRGSAVMDIEDQNFTMRPNDSILIFPDTFHRISYLEDNSTLLSFGFPVEKITKVTESDYHSTFMEFVNRENEYALIQQNPILTEYIKSLNARIHLDSAFSKESVQALLILLFTEMLLPIFSKKKTLNNESTKGSEYDSQVQMIENYFNDHYMENISLSNLSRTLCLSEKQTNRIIKRAFGAEFRECLSKIRLKSAKKLLRETNTDVKDIAAAVGYQSYNGFYLAFRSKFNKSPLEYRKLYAPKDI